MAEVTFHLKPAAEAARNAERAAVLKMRREGYADSTTGLWRYLDSETVRERLLEIDHKFFRREFFAESDPQENVGVRCPGCSALHIMARSSQTYACKCAPNFERSALIGREALTA